jgi:hypothetical protein
VAIQFFSVRNKIMPKAAVANRGNMPKEFRAQVEERDSK